MTRRDTLQTVHEPFGDAFYFGPERLHDRYENDPEERKNSGFGDSTYRTIFDNIARDGSEVRCFPPPPFASILDAPTDRRVPPPYHIHHIALSIIACFCPMHS